LDYNPEEVMLIGPKGRPLNEEMCVLLGSKYGATDYDYYLFDDAIVWCFESPNNGYSQCRWYPIPPDRWDEIELEEKSLRQLVEQHKRASF
jgi:hypothetical protein